MGQMIIPTACRPYSEMARIGDHYWPDGLPEGSSAPTGFKCDFIDYKTGEKFSICYTNEQIRIQIRKNGVFAPYFPLLMSGRVY